MGRGDNEHMPPPAFGRVSSDPDSGFKRTQSQNCDATTMRLRIKEAFKATDVDGSGEVDKEELSAVLKTLQIDLKDPVNDIEVIFQFLDKDKRDGISEEEWCEAFEPAIYRATVIHGQKKMDFEDLLKDTFNLVLEDARKERGLVIETFMLAYEEVKGGFGTRFLTNKWRFAIFDAFYSMKQFEAGVTPWDYLLRCLEETIKKDLSVTNWAEEALGGQKNEEGAQELFMRSKSVEDSCKEVKDPKVISEFCEHWLKGLKNAESRRPHAVKDAQSAVPAA